MNRETYRLLENYMLSCVEDAAHDSEHIYRVLDAALDIASHEENVDYDILITACLLHDVARGEQARNPSLSHAIVGADKAAAFLREHGFDEAFIAAVADCIRAHSYRNQAGAGSIEAKILFDADKVDVAGAIGIARTLMYGVVFDEPLYSRLPDGSIDDGTGDSKHSFLHEYMFKLRNVAGKLNTARGRELAESRQASAKAFYDSLQSEITSLDRFGKARREELFSKEDARP